MVSVLDELYTIKETGAVRASEFLALADEACGLLIGTGKTFIDGMNKRR